MDRIEKERLNIPIAAFQFWEQQDFKAKLNETKTQGIAYLLMEMFKIRRSKNILHMHPEKADEYFKLKWSKPITGYRTIKVV